MYKVQETQSGAKSGGAAWGSGKCELLPRTVYEKGRVLISAVANNAPFFGQLAKQIATLEGGG